MNLTNDKVIGIVGGVGPQAGHALLDAIVRNTIAARDQEHLSVVLMSFPKHIEDRTSFLDRRSDINPAFNITSVIRKLEIAGARVAGIACNTAHAPEIYNVIIEELDKTNSTLKLINMAEETCNHILVNHRSVKKIGLMTTNGTYKCGLYKNLLSQLGYDVVLPDFKFQNEVIHKMIYDPVIGLKGQARQVSNEALSLMERSLSFFKNNEVDAVVLGCTELSLIKQVREHWGDLIIVDSLEVMARALIREAMT